MEWTEDPLVWDGLDDLLTNAWPDAVRFFDALHEHSNELDATMKAIMFGGIGQLMKSYNEARSELNDPNQSLAIALEQVTKNPLFSRFMQTQINEGLDSVIEGMEGSA